MDNADRADRDMEMLAEAAERQRVRYIGESARQCASCGCDIPEARRKALPGIRLCVDCAAERER